MGTSTHWPQTNANLALKMDTLHELLDIETRGWQALSSNEQVARKYYEGILADEAVMVFPAGLVLRGKRNILDSFATQPWAVFDIQEPLIVPLRKDAAILAYRVTAKRTGSEQYDAHISSTYCQKNGAWQLVFHQHTP